MRNVLTALGFFACASAAAADSAALNLYALRTPDYPLAAVRTAFAAAPGKAVRVTIYDSAETFLERPVGKRFAFLNEEGVALVPLDGLAPGEYALAAYLDENGDGELNRGKVFGIPKEPVAFSNGVVPKLSKPTFDQTKVRVAPGEVVIITLED